MENTEMITKEVMIPLYQRTEMVKNADPLSSNFLSGTKRKIFPDASNPGPADYNTMESNKKRMEGK